MAITAAANQFLTHHIPQDVRYYDYHYVNFNG